MVRAWLLAGTAFGLVMAAPASAADAAPAAATDGPASTDIVITASKLDEARDQIQPSLGASEFKFDREALNNQPQGADRNLTQVLLQAPGVTQDSNGAVHVRNEHGNLQYRLNGIIVPEGISGFGQTFDPRIANSIELITGTLPAQYGYRTSGVVSLSTKSGAFENGGDIGIYGGSHDTIEPSATIRGSTGSLNYFFSGSYLHNDLGVEKPTSAREAIHDKTDQYRAFGYLSDILSDTSRLTLFGGTAIGKFQIPDNPGQVPAFTYNGRSSFDSALLDQNQHETTHYGVLAYQYAGDRLKFQVAPFIRYSQTRFTPDPAGGDLIFNGFADRSRLSSLAAGVQADASYTLSDQHKLRFGLFFQDERTRSDIVTRVFPVDAAGDQTSDQPITIPTTGSKTGQLYGVYLQDEWTVTPELTVNAGVRFDAVRAYTHEQQVSPRLNLVYKPADGTTIHAGYARNFTPPPQELIGATTVAQFNGTTREAAITTAGPVRAEREHYFDAGIQQAITKSLTLGVDTYYKIKRNLLDEGQFGSSLVLSPFNYAKGKAWGVELRADYNKGPVSLYANVARGQEKGKDIVSSQFFFDPAELDYIAHHYIFTDHSQNWTASGGGSVTIKDGIGTLVPSADFVFGSGLRREDPNGIVPNGGKLPSYVQVNFGIAQNFSGPGFLEGVTLRFDVVNLLDESYILRDGTGVGVGAPQYGPRRGFFVGLSKSF